MLILKSFYRQKSTKIYLAIITLIFTAILAVFSIRVYNINNANYNLRKSYLIFDAKKEEQEKIEQIKGINNIIFGIKSTAYATRAEWDVFEEPNDLILISNNTISPNHAVGNFEASFLFEMYTSEVYLNEEHLEFTIDYYLEEKEEEEYSYLYISPNDFNNLNSKVSNYTYIVNLDKWLDKKKVISKLEKEIPSLTNLEEHEYNVRTLDYSLMNIILFTVLLVILSIIFIVVLIVNIKNILIDEHKKTRLYECLGFHKSTIKKYHSLEISSLILLSLIISSIIVGLAILLL